MEIYTFREKTASSNVTETCIKSRCCRGLPFVHLITIHPSLHHTGSNLFTSSYLTHYPQANQEVTRATSLTLNCYNVHHPAFFFWLNMTFTIPHTLFYHFFHIWGYIKRIHYEKSRLKVTCDKYHWNWKSATDTCLQGSKGNYYFFVLCLRKGLSVHTEIFNRLQLHPIVQQKFSIS